MSLRLRRALLLLVAASGGAALSIAAAFGVRFGPESPDEAARRILERGLHEEKAHALLRSLLEAAPMRLTGSPGAEAALAHMEAVMRGLGFANVHREAVRVERWERGAETAVIEASAFGPEIDLAVCALGGSVGTAPEGLAAEVLEVRSFRELEAAADAARGKIVFFNRPMDRAVLDPFRAYGENAELRVRGAVEAAKRGAVAVLVRSLTMRRDRHPHTGLMRYEDGPPRIPAAAVATEDADGLSARLRETPGLTVRLKLGCRSAGSVWSSNLIGELRGSERPGEIILIGGHLDAWDLGSGAHDDGAGCVHAVEALRLIKAVGLVPKRTIRAVLFMDEEFGGTGGRSYAGAPEREGERHLAAFESDRGGFLPLAVGIGGGPEVLRRFEGLGALLRSSGVVLGLVAGGGGVDIAPLAEQGALLGGLIPDAARYFDHHHSALDVLEAVHPRELELGAIALALTAFLIARDGI
ncbi:MAG: M20/M25/M40 family metallo-hydrolase [Candidatus Aminicenantes bacterium]|nr:M20/M25/M40 family metallo-hydrolase [Candidatus Aminicenantes bacterium]